MTFDPARPRYTLPFAGEEYELLGDLALVEALEYAMKDGIIQIAGKVIDMGVTDTSKLLSAILTSCGQKKSANEIGGIIFNLGVSSEAFQALKLHVYAFLRIVLEPPEAREKMAKKMGELLGEWSVPSASPGKRTRKSA